MIKLKKKIRVISSLPPSLDDKNKTFNTLLTLIILILVGLGLYIGYKKVLPYINMIGKKVTYIVYKTFQTDENDTSFYNRDTNGAREITLSTCTDDSSARTIILAKAQGD